MRPRERREEESQARCVAGDPRAILLAHTPVAERSEAAARYDHADEAAELDTPREPTETELSEFRVSLWRANVACQLAERAVYRDGVMRYLGGHRVSAGLALEITQTESATAMPTDTEVRAAWQQGSIDRRTYIYQRYGV